MALAVQTDMSTPALANFGSEALKQTYLAPALAGTLALRLSQQYGERLQNVLVTQVCPPQPSTWVSRGGGEEEQEQG